MTDYTLNPPMIINEYGHALLSAGDIIQGLYQGKLTNLTNLYIDDQKLVDEYNQAVKLNADPFSPLTQYVKPHCTPAEYDHQCQSKWLIPNHYLDFDIEYWLLSQCRTPEQELRVGEELVLYNQYGLLTLLKAVKYLVDTMREHKILWGVGRGSSVSSYCLYLIGLHKIDSLKYDLSITDFLKSTVQKEN